jgi:hypothetical protein
MNMSRFSLVLSIAALGCSSSTQQQPTTPTPMATPMVEPTPMATPTPTVETPVEPPPVAAPAFVATAEQRAAWQHATTMLEVSATANAGGGQLRTGFTPDPWAFPLTAGGGRNPVDVATLSIVDAATGTACGRSFVTRRPDFHFTFAAGTTFPLLRFYVVTGNNSDATLLINGANGEWRCNDDHGHSDWGGNLMPAIDFHEPPAGRYDIWVGSYDASRGNPANLYVTELDSNHP